MTYATVAELKAFIGTSLAVSAIADADITEMLLMSYNEIVAKLLADAVTPPVADTTLKAAEINLTMNRVVTRGKIDNSISDSDGSAGEYAVYDVDSAIYLFYTRGWELTEMYIRKIKLANNSAKPRMVKANG